MALLCGSCRSGSLKEEENYLAILIVPVSIVNQSGVVVADAVSLNLTMSIDLLLAASVVSDNKVSLQLSIANHQSRCEFFFVFFFGGFFFFTSKN